MTGILENTTSGAGIAATRVVMLEMPALRPAVGIAYTIAQREQNSRRTAPNRCYSLRSTGNKEGKATRYAYCDVWRFSDGNIAELTAFVIVVEQGPLV